MHLIKWHLIYESRNVFDLFGQKDPSREFMTLKRATFERYEKIYVQKIRLLCMHQEMKGGVTLQIS